MSYLNLLKFNSIGKEIASTIAVSYIELIMRTRISFRRQMTSSLRMILMKNR